MQHTDPDLAGAEEMPNKSLPEEILLDSECSQVVGGTESDIYQDREIWILRIPRDVSLPV